MPIELPLNRMSFAEKLQLMEVLWDDLSHTPIQLESPEWHKNVLEECRRRAESGEETFTDWEEAKKRIRERVS